MGQKHNVVTCDVLQAIEDLSEMILLLRCQGMTSEYADLHITMSKTEWNMLEKKDTVQLYFEPENILVMDK